MQLPEKESDMKQKLLQLNKPLHLALKGYLLRHQQVFPLKMVQLAKSDRKQQTQ